MYNYECCSWCANSELASNQVLRLWPITRGDPSRKGATLVETKTPEILALHGCTRDASCCIPHINWTKCAFDVDNISIMAYNSEPPSSPPTLPVAILPRPDRKRRHQQLNDVSTISSDPPLFSSDPPDAALDSDRRKRTYRGPWWAVKSDLSRNFDSGVFIPSDDTLPNFDQSAQYPASTSRTKHVAIQSHTSSSTDRAWIIVEEALEKGEEVVDLS